MSLDHGAPVLCTNPKCLTTAELIAANAERMPEAVALAAPDRSPLVANRVQAAFDLELPLKTIFRVPTISGLALVIEELVLAEVEAM